MSRRFQDLRFAIANPAWLGILSKISIPISDLKNLDALASPETAENSEVRLFVAERKNQYQK